MKLYSVALSPFAARVRMAIYAKKLDQIEILPPPGGGTKSPEYLAIHPMGKVPALVTVSRGQVPGDAAPSGLGGGKGQGAPRDARH